VTSEQTIVSEGRRLVDEAAAREIGVRLVGGAAIWIRASEHARGLLGRTYPDLDLVAHRKQSRPLRDLLEELEYEPERTFNAMHGARRLLYHASDRSFHLDVFLDEFVMSHTLDLGARLEMESPTLPAAELLLTKLQVAEVNVKDLNDATMLLLDHEVAESDGPRRLNAAYVAAELAADWGLYTTVLDNIDKLSARVPELLDVDDAALVLARANDVRRRIEAAPKSRSWKLRAKIGRRVRWYELPEEVTR
jgi:hypothetical protein